MKHSSLKQKVSVLLICLFVMLWGWRVVFADTPNDTPTAPTSSPGDSSSTIQSSPNIVLQPSADTLNQVNQLFSDQATYKNFKKYPKLKLFDIPKRSQ